VSSSSPFREPAVLAPRSLEGRRYLVGGGSRGLGFAVARELIRAGAELLLVARDPERLAKAQDELGSVAHAHAADLSSASGSDNAAKVVATVWPEGLDGALINAGGPPRGNALELDDEAWRASYELLLGGPLRLVRSLRAQLRDGSALLFVASSAVREPVPGLDTSNVLRPAVAALARALARELAPGVRVNAIAPGRFATSRAIEGDERRARAEGISVAEVRDRGAAAIPLGRYGDPAEFGRVGAFLLSPAASYVTGATLQIDGGLVASAH
jgi:3-oxoacyl-[acyl-carrier protein] reductase